MDDLVKRLRMWSADPLCVEAADRIEVLEAEVARARRDADCAVWTRAEEQVKRIEALERESIQMKFALGYPMPADLERHVIPENPFKCGACEARSTRIEELEQAVVRFERETVKWRGRYYTARREALEEAARVADGLVHPKLCHCEKIAAAIRALKEKK